MGIQYLEGLQTGFDESIYLPIRWNDVRIVVRLDRASSCDVTHPTLRSFVENYNSACYSGDYEKAEALSDEIFDFIVEKARSILDNIAPPAPPNSSSHSLHTLLFPREYALYFQNLDGKAELVREDALQSHITIHHLHGPFHLQVDETCAIPRYCTRDIIVLENLADNGHIARVEINGQQMCCKTGGTQGKNAAQRELDCLWEISASGWAGMVRVPKLFGLVQTPDSKRIVGFLLEYIPVPDPWELWTLGNIEPSRIDESRRNKWALQVQETVDLLHEIGVIWGDGKASNVLIHRDSDDAWVIDFGGGYTDSWLDQELHGTVEADNLAVKGIFAFLKV